MGRRRREVGRPYRFLGLECGEVLVRSEEILQATYGALGEAKKSSGADCEEVPALRRILRRLDLLSEFPAHLSCSLSSDLVRHARTSCTRKNPKCNTCPLVSFCAFGAKRATRHDRRRPTAVDLCAGAGGLSSGFRREGFHVVLAVEKDRSAAQSYRVNNPGVPVIEADIKRVRTAELLKALGLRKGKITAVIAGPPCQGYSAAGLRDAEDKRNFLFRSISRIATELEASLVVMENVPGLRRVAGVSFERRILNCFGRAGYAGRSVVADAAAFGVPQRRKRIIFVFSRGDIDVGSFDLRQPRRTDQSTVIQALQSLPRPTRRRQNLASVAAVPIYNHRAMAHSEKVIKKIRRLKHGAGPLSYRRLGHDLAQTLIAGHRALPVHPRAHRTITVREAARLQTLPDHFRFLGPHSEQPLQVANVVPYLLSRAIARSLLTFMNGCSRRLGNGN